MNNRKLVEVRVCWSRLGVQSSRIKPNPIRLGLGMEKYWFGSSSAHLKFRSSGSALAQFWKVLVWLKLELGQLNSSSDCLNFLMLGLSLFKSNEPKQAK